MSTTEMNHPPDDVLLHAVHDPTWASADLCAHLDACGTCRARQQQLRIDDGFVGGLLDVLDHPVPALSAREIIARPPRYLRRRALLVAEITIFAVAAAAAMTIPASPLHRWLVREKPPAAVAIAPASPEAPTQAGEPAPVGIALPVPASLSVEFRQAQHAGTLEVHLVDSGQVTVRSRGGVVGFTVDEGRVVVDNRVPAEEYIVEVPVSLRRVRITVGTRLLFEKDGDRIGPVAPFATARYRIPLTDTARSKP